MDQPLPVIEFEEAEGLTIYWTQHRDKPLPQLVVDILQKCVKSWLLLALLQAWESNINVVCGWLLSSVDPAPIDADSLACKAQKISLRFKRKTTSWEHFFAAALEASDPLFKTLEQKLGPYFAESIQKILECKDPRYPDIPPES